MKPSTLIPAIGVLLAVFGLFMPSAALVGTLHTSPGILLDQLLLGATIFRVGLIVLGLLIIALSRTSIWSISTPNETPQPRLSYRLSTSLLLAVLIVATALRLYKLGEGLWFDEIMTYVQYAKLSFGEIVTTYDSQNQHFLYSILAHASFLIFGEGAWALRLPSVLFGVGSVWMLFLLGRQIGSTREGLLAAGLFTFSYHHIWFSQNARGYMGLLFWTLVASWLLLKALDEGRPHLWVLYAVSAALGVYTHMTMIFVLMGQFIIYGIASFRRREGLQSSRWIGLLLGFGLAGLLVLQLHALVLPQIFGGGVVGEGAEASVSETWKNPLWMLLEFARALQISLLSGLVASVALLVFGIGLWSFARNRPEVVQLLVLPSSICAVVVIGLGHHLWPRFFFFAFGFAVLVAIRGMVTVGDFVAHRLGWVRERGIALGVFMCCGVIGVSLLSIPAVYAPKQDYAEALWYVEGERQPHDAVVTVGLTTYPYQSLYNRDWESIDSLTALTEVRARAERTWLFYTLPIHLQSVHPEIMANLQADFEVMKTFPGTLGGGAIIVCLAHNANWESAARQASDKTTATMGRMTQR